MKRVVAGEVRPHYAGFGAYQATWYDTDFEDIDDWLEYQNDGDRSYEPYPNDDLPNIYNYVDGCNAYGRRGDNGELTLVCLAYVDNVDGEK